MIKKKTLKNGLRIVAVPMKNAKSVTVLILVGTGSKYETREMNGMSHFLEHMFFKGTKRRPNTLKISETLDMIGGAYNAFTSKEVTGFWAKVDKKNTDVALDWISDMFLHSKFEQEEIDREKGVVIEEANMYLDMPQSHVSEIFEELLYGDQPSGWRIVGPKENILAFNREKLIEYYKGHYASHNTVVCVAGDISAKQIEQKIEKYFAGIEKSEAPKKEATKEVQQKPGMLVQYKKTDQTHFCLGVRAYDMFDKRRYALSLMAIMLGGNMSSRLFISVRERHGLGYYVHTSVDTTTDSGFLVTQTGIKNGNLQKAVELILQEYKDFKQNKITPRELKKAKDYIRGSMSLSMDSTDALASFYANQEVMEGKIESPEQKLKMIDKVTINDIKKVAEDIFTSEKLNLSVIGPIEEVERGALEKILAL